MSIDYQDLTGKNVQRRFIFTKSYLLEVWDTDKETPVMQLS